MHNTFAVPVFITSVGIVDWAINEIREIRCKTRKQLSMTGTFHPNGDVDRLVRLKEKLLGNYEIEWKENTTPKNLSKIFVKADIESHRKRYNTKVMPGYYEKKLEQDPGIDRFLSFLWEKDRYVTSGYENYLSTIQDQKLPTKYLQYKRVIEKGNILNHNNKCRLCMSNVEDTGHILADCPQISSRFYFSL